MEEEEDPGDGGSARKSRSNRQLAGVEDRISIMVLGLKRDLRGTKSPETVVDPLEVRKTFFPLLCCVFLPPLLSHCFGLFSPASFPFSFSFPVSSFVVWLFIPSYLLSFFQLPSTFSQQLIKFFFFFVCVYV